LRGGAQGTIDFDFGSDPDHASWIQIMIPIQNLLKDFWMKFLMKWGVVQGFFLFFYFFYCLFIYLFFSV